MTFKEALDTGLRIQSKYWKNTEQGKHWWYKKINENQFLSSEGILEIIKTGTPYTGEGYTIHPEDQKLYDFNKELNKLLD